MVIVLLAIISGVLVVFLTPATTGYFDTVRRAQMVNTADFALRRIARDLANSVPNSVRSSDPLYVEMLALRSAGRYCNDSDCATGALSALIDSDRTFGALGAGVTAVLGDSVVAGNLPASGCDAYAAPAASTNRRTLIAPFGSGLTTLRWSPSQPLLDNTCAQLTKRFQVISGPVTYACDSSTATLWRYDNYSINPSAPANVAAAMTAGGNGAAVATNVVCSAGGGATGFDATQVGQGLVELRIQLSASGETVSLYRQVRVDNSP